MLLKPLGMFSMGFRIRLIAYLPIRILLGEMGWIRIQVLDPDPDQKSNWIRIPTRISFPSGISPGLPARFLITSILTARKFGPKTDHIPTTSRRFFLSVRELRIQIGILIAGWLNSADPDPAIQVEDQQIHNPDYNPVPTLPTVYKIIGRCPMT
jgi:hypothetical protein